MSKLAYSVVWESYECSKMMISSILTHQLQDTQGNISQTSNEIVTWAHKSQMNPFEFYHYALSFQTRESVYEDVIRRADVSQDKDLHQLLWSAC